MTMSVYRTVAEVPILGHSFPFRLRMLHQIEITSRCNLRCVYCPSRDIIAGKYPGRVAVDMSREHFLQALRHVKYFIDQGTQSELNLAGIGESTLHPDFIDFMRLARETLGDKVGLGLATNGVALTEEHAAAAARYGVAFWVSLHRPEKAGPAIQLLRKYHVLVGTSDDPALNASTWAGQVDWFYSQPYISPCIWLREGRAMALADGRITTCCYDAAGAGVIGHVDDALGSLWTKPYGLCRTCEQEIAVAGCDQRTP